MITQFQSQIKIHFNAPKEKVWEALTNPEIVKQYFFGTHLVTEWVPGKEIRFEGEWEGKSYTDKGVVQEYQANHHLAYTYLSNWANLDDKPENYLYIRYEVADAEGGTLLTITQSNYDEERMKHSEGNWTSLMEAMRKLVED